MSNEKLIDKMNDALALELRAINMYAHYSATVMGINRMQLAPYFSKEVSESISHADIVRRGIVKLGGIPVTERNNKDIVHTTDYQLMLNEAYDTEKVAAKAYTAVMDLLKDAGDRDLFDAVEQVCMMELRALEELRLLTA
jgi:bacterioferritin (cytochrome b1)